MASPRGKYSADVNLAVTPEMKEQLSDIAWKNRLSLRALIRQLVTTELRIRIGIKTNDRAKELWFELLRELNVDERKGDQ